LFDDIGWPGISATDFTADLAAVTAPRLDVRISSHGGSVVDGLAIYNALRRRGGVTTYVDGIAASIASVIFLAGDRRVIARHGQVMVHNASSGAFGDADEHRKAAETLDQIADTLAQIYAERAGGTVESWRALMAVETWFTADESRLAGLATEVDAADAAWDQAVARLRAANAAWDRAVAHLTVKTDAASARRNWAAATAPLRNNR
jgi:ATP-dependent protease ClpP protease subunit